MLFVVLFGVFFKYDCYILFFLTETHTDSPCLQGLNQSEALQVPRCIFLYRFCFTCINILFEQLQPLTVKARSRWSFSCLGHCSSPLAKGVGGAGALQWGLPLGGILVWCLVVVYYDHMKTAFHLKLKGSLFRKESGLDTKGRALDE